MTTNSTETASTIPADETPLACIHRSCDRLDAMFPPATLNGDAARHLTRDIRQAAGELHAAAELATDLLAEALTDLQAAHDEPRGH